MGFDWTISSVLKISKISILIIFCLMSKLIGWKPSKTRICSIQFNWKLIAIQLQTQPPVDRSLLNVKVFISDFRENNRNSNKNEHWSCRIHLWLFWFSERWSGSPKSGASLGQKFCLGHRTSNQRTSNIHVWMFGDVRYFLNIGIFDVRMFAYIQMFESSVVR